MIDWLKPLVLGSVRYRLNCVRATDEGKLYICTSFQPSGIMLIVCDEDGNVMHGPLNLSVPNSMASSQRLGNSLGKIKKWVNFYPDRIAAYTDRNVAQTSAAPDRIGMVQMEFDLDAVNGRFDEA